MLLYSVAGIHKRSSATYRISVYFVAFEQAEAYKNDIKTKCRQYKEFAVQSNDVQHLDLVSYVDELGNLIVDGAPTKFYYSKVG